MLVGGEGVVVVIRVEDKRTGAGVGAGLRVTARAEPTTWEEEGSGSGEVTGAAGGVGGETGVEASSDFVAEAGIAGGAKTSFLVSICPALADCGDRITSKAAPVGVGETVGSVLDAVFDRSEFCAS